MSINSLATYLSDHLAGSESAVRLVARLAERYDGEAADGFFTRLLAEIEADQQLLRVLIDRVGAGSMPKLKSVAAKVVETLARPKLDLDPSARDTLGLFESLEVLSLGVLGKRALWRALALLVDDKRISEVDYGELERRATEQYEALERRRLDAARDALT